VSTQGLPCVSTQEYLLQDFMQNRAHLAMPPLDAFIAENPKTEYSRRTLREDGEYLS
jgi:hypothetical protein